MSPRDHVPSTRTLHRIRTMFLPKWVTSRKPSRLYILIDPVYCGWEVLVRQGETPQQPRLPACECSPLLNAARISSSPHDVGVCQQIDMRCATAALRPLPVPASHRRGHSHISESHSLDQTDTRQLVSQRHRQASQSHVLAGQVPCEISFARLASSGQIAPTYNGGMYTSSHPVRPCASRRERARAHLS